MSSNNATRRRSPLLAFATRDADQAAARFDMVYRNAVGVTAVSARAAFSLKASLARIGALTLSRVQMQNAALRRDTRNEVIVLFPGTGPFILRAGASVSEYSSRAPFTVTLPFASHVLIVEQAQGMALTAPVEGLTARIERITGEPCHRSTVSRMADFIDPASAAGQALARSVRTAFSEIADLDRLGLGPMAVSGYEEILFNLLAAALFPEFVQSEKAILDCGSILVGRARDFIRENAAQTIEISRLAADLGVSMRALQQNFLRTYGFSPRDYVLECRLEIARQALLSRDPARTVTDIAFASGFTDLSHFSAKYRNKYGELPSATLRGYTG